MHELHAKSVIAVMTKRDARSSGRFVVGVHPAVPIIASSRNHHSYSGKIWTSPSPMRLVKDPFTETNDSGTQSGDQFDS